MNPLTGPQHRSQSPESRPSSTALGGMFGGRRAAHVSAQEAGRPPAHGTGKKSRRKYLDTVRGPSCRDGSLCRIPGFFPSLGRGGG